MTVKSAKKQDKKISMYGLAPTLLVRNGAIKMGYVIRVTTDYKNFTSFTPLTIPIHVMLSEDAVVEHHKLFNNQDVWHMLPA